MVFHVVLFPPQVTHSHIDDIGTPTRPISERIILPVITGNIPVGNLEMATKVRADSDAFTRLPSKDAHQSPAWEAPLSRREALRSPPHALYLGLIVVMVMSLQFLYPSSTRQGQVRSNCPSPIVIAHIPFFDPSPLLHFIVTPFKFPVKYFLVLRRSWYKEVR